MPKILISLVSNETISNIQLIKEFGFIDNYLFISTKEMEKTGCREWIIQATAISYDKILDSVIVDENDFDDIEKKLSELIFSDNDELYLNITGGNKIMSIVTLDYFKDLGAKIFFVSAEKNQYTRLFPKTRIKSTEFKSDITIKEYFEAFGFSVKSYGSISQPESVTEQVFAYFAPFFNPDTKIISPHSRVFPELQTVRNKKQVAIAEIEGLQELLDDLKFSTVKTGFIGKEEIVYLSGGWFEEYIFNKVKSELGLDEEHLTIGLYVEKSGVVNEFDVVFVMKNKIYTIECKTSVYYQDNGKTRTTIGDFVYKCDSLQSELGLYPITAIATLSALKDKMGRVNQIAEAHYKRAELYKVKILAYSEISSQKTISELLNIDVSSRK